VTTRITALTGEGMAVSDDVLEWWVEARANVLGLRYGERAIIPANTPELAECIAMRLIVLVGEDGSVPDPRPPARSGGCGGCGQR
jgi:hypothetical protein